jgi:hypothetical protein
MYLNERRNKLHAFSLAVLAALLGVIALVPMMPIHAQQASTGSVCVLAFNDVNSNGSRDPGETLLADIAVNLMVNGNVIIANHVSDNKEPHCFTELSAQQYTVGFNSPLHTPTTLTSLTFPLASGERVTKEFGAAVAAATEAAPATGGITLAVTPPVRIGLSAVAAVVAMLFVAALGLILYGLFGKRRSDSG